MNRFKQMAAESLIFSVTSIVSALRTQLNAQPVTKLKIESDFGGQIFRLMENCENRNSEIVGGVEI